LSTYIFMKVLESVPGRYDRIMRWLTRGNLVSAYDRLTGHIGPGQQVLDLGCGTGELALRAAKRGATVKGIDINPGMLEIARKRADEAGLSERTEWEEAGIVELEDYPESYDAVTSGLCFSELSLPEQKLTAETAYRLLKPGGLFLLADEVSPTHYLKRVLNGLLRWPLKAITWLLVQSGTRPLKNPEQLLRECGFELESVRMNRMENFIELAARKPGKKT